MRKKIRFRLGSHVIAMQFWNIQVKDRLGITNECEDGMLLPFFDFQNEPVTELYNVYHALDSTVQEWGLSTAYVIQSYPRISYRAFCLDKVTFRECIAILSGTDYIDENYIRSLGRRRHSVLRVLSKEGDQDKCVSMIRSQSVLRKKSARHAVFFKVMYGITLPLDVNIPKEETVSLPMWRYESKR